MKNNTDENLFCLVEMIKGDAQLQEQNLHKCASQGCKKCQDTLNLRYSLNKTKE